MFENNFMKTTLVFSAPLAHSHFTRLICTGELARPSPNVVFSSCHCFFSPKYIPHWILILPLPQGQASKIVLIFAQYSSFPSTNQTSSTFFQKKFRTSRPPSKTNSAATAVVFSPNFRVGRQPAFVSAAVTKPVRVKLRYGRDAEAKPQGERGHILLQ